MSAETPNRPNFVVFVTDHHRWDHLGCAGHPLLRTPNLDALAAQGMRFNRCYTVHPLCMPTRSTWFTGQTPRGHGTRCNGVPLDPRVPTMTEALRRGGYATHGIGKIHLRPFRPPADADPAKLDPAEWPECRALWDAGRIAALPTPYYGLDSVDFLSLTGNFGSSHYLRWLVEREPRGPFLLSPEASKVQGDGGERTWELMLPTDLHYTRWMAECAGNFLRRRAADQRPFFLWWSAPDPCPPYAAPKPWCEMYRPGEMPKPVRREGELDRRPPHYRLLYEKGVHTAGRTYPTRVSDEAIARVRAMVCAMISQVDDAVGRVVKDLEALGLLENTVVVFMADHGQMLGDHWMLSMPPCHLDGTLRVPCLWRWPKRFVRGQASEALVSHLDFAPTVLELAGAELLTPEAGAVTPGALPPLPGRSLVPLLTGAVRRVQDSVLAENDEDYLGLRMRTLVTEEHHLTMYAGQPYGELHDLRADPDQMENIWDHPGSRGVRLELLARLADRLAQTDSVLPRKATSL